jgi:hypothetical protein
LADEQELSASVPISQPATLGRRPPSAPFCIEPIRKEFPKSGNGDKARDKEEGNNHLNDGEVHGIASNEITGNKRREDHNRADDQVQHDRRSGDRFGNKLSRLLPAELDAHQAVIRLRIIQRDCTARVNFARFEKYIWSS